MSEARGPKPLLLLDVDGVLNPFPATPEGYLEYELFPGDGEPVRLCSRHAEWLRELAAVFEIAWASGWGEAANEVICPIFDLPPFPVVPFPAVPFQPRDKVPAVAAFTGERPTAWVEDIVTGEARVWAAQRVAPTLIVEVSSTFGLTREIVEELLAWGTMLESSNCDQLDSLTKGGDPGG